MELLVPFLAAVWLATCAGQDWRRREVSNWLILPPLGLGLLLRLPGFGGGSPVLLLVAAGALLLGWRAGWLGGADLKASLALACFDLRLLGWAWLGLVAWYLLLHTVFRRADLKRLPGFVGFTTGMVLCVLWEASCGV